MFKTKISKYILGQGRLIIYSSDKLIDSSKAQRLQFWESYWNF